MTLAATVRSVIARVKAEVADLMVTVSLESKTGQDGDGKATFSAPVEYDVVVWREGDEAAKKITRLLGIEHVHGTNVFFLENLVIAEGDRITLEDDTVVPISSIENFPDPSGGFFYQWAKCGRPERGTLQS